MTTTHISGYDDLRMYGTGDLAVFLGGSGDSFTGLLVVLMQKADPGNLARLRFAFPRETRAWETWNAMSPAPTFRELREALQWQDADMAAEGLAAADLDEKAMSDFTARLREFAEEMAGDVVTWPGTPAEDLPAIAEGIMKLADPDTT